MSVYPYHSIALVVPKHSLNEFFILTGKSPSSARLDVYKKKD